MAAPAAGRRRSRVAVVARVLAVVLLVVTLVVLVSLLPTLNRATPGMSEAAGERVVVHYEQEEAAALEVLATAVSTPPRSRTPSGSTRRCATRSMCMTSRRRCSASAMAC